MKYLNIILALIIFASLASCSGSKSESNDIETLPLSLADTVQVIKGTLPCLDSLVCVEGTVKSGQFFSTLLTSLGLSQQHAYNLTEASRNVFDVRALRVGNPYTACYSEAETPDGESRLEYLIYEKDAISCIVFKCTPEYDAWEYKKPITTRTSYVDVTINTSLWNDMISEGASPLLILTLSDIYSWTVDFFGLQKGDRFRVLYDEKLCENKVMAIDTVRYSVYSHAGKDFPMVMFDQKDGGNIWWNENGESMRKAFLKAPLKYSRISSGFSYARKHPVTRKVQPHTGVDYAAPAGTPVMSIGDGVVISRKYEGAGGNTVRIRHNSVYTTAYLHLSRYASGLKQGQRVHQGDVIGYVGSTGRSTGPHLDFRVWKNGSPINPLKMESPAAEPLKKENMDAFRRNQSRFEAQVDSIHAATHARILFDLL